MLNATENFTAAEAMNYRAAYHLKLQEINACIIKALESGDPEVVFVASPISVWVEHLRSRGFNVMVQSTTVAGCDVTKSIVITLK